MAWQKGQSGNPGGRPRMAEGVRQALKENGAKAAERMRSMLEDDTAWGPKGWLDSKTQVKLLDTAIIRGYGSQPADEQASLPPGAAMAGLLRDVYEGIKGEMPEMRHARPAGSTELPSPDVIEGQTAREEQRSGDDDGNDDEPDTSEPEDDEQVDRQQSDEAPPRPRARKRRAP